MRPLAQTSQGVRKTWAQRMGPHGRGPPKGIKNKGSLEILVHIETVDGGLIETS